VRPRGQSGTRLVRRFRGPPVPPIFCGRPAGRRHHPTAKDEQGRYLDPEFTVATCRDHHELLGDDRRTLDLETTEFPLTWLDGVEVRLRRMAIDAARLASSHPGNRWFALAADVLARWAGELAAFRCHLDERDPHWREDPGFYPGGAPTSA
jgi:hypothetical protein